MPPTRLIAEPITGVVAHHGEGPFWDARASRLLCLDVLAGVVIAVDTYRQIDRFEVPSSTVSAIRRRTSGGFVIATERGVVVADESLAVFDQIAEVTCDRRVRNNDGGCDPLGAFVLGTMGYCEESDIGVVYRVAPGGEVVELLAPVSISNGVQWSADGSCAYYIDTPTRRIDVVDVDAETGAWRRRRPHIDVHSEAGFPDGMAIDEDGGLWVALWGGGGVNHYGADGRLVETIVVPGVTQVSSCAFGGHDRSVLFITTSRLGLAEGHESYAGAVFAVETGSRGSVQYEFAG